ncbi:MAG: hypothetical protein R2724_14320 [Bryobacterales bacterium]
MNPGFDQARHGGLRREISFDCMGCHNGYPTIEAGADLPGRDPLLPRFALRHRLPALPRTGASAHVEAVQRGAAEEIRAAMFNPAEADPQRGNSKSVCSATSNRPAAGCPIRYTTSTRRLFLSPRRAASRLRHAFRPSRRRVREDKFEIAHHGYQFLRLAVLPASEGMTHRLS